MAGNANSGRRKPLDLSAAIKPVGNTTDSIQRHLASISAVLVKGEIETKRAEALTKIAAVKARLLAAGEVDRLQKLLRAAERLFEAGLANQARERQHVAETQKDGEHFDG